MMVRMTIGSKARRAREPRRVHVAGEAKVTDYAVIQRCEYCAEDLVRMGPYSEPLFREPIGDGSVTQRDLPPFERGDLVVFDGTAPEPLVTPIGSRDVVCTPLPPGGDR